MNSLINPHDNNFVPGLDKSPDSSSSSSSEGNNYVATTLTYACDCIDQDSIINPLTGKHSAMTYKGFFSKVDVISQKGTPHVKKGSLERNSANNGAFICKDAGNLFSMSQGCVRINLILPYDVTNGVYEPSSTSIDSEIEDYVLWAVNMGNSYISQPGLYAAMTPYGIEFTIWSSEGRYTIIDSYTNCVAGNELLLEFFWNSDHLTEGGNMSIHSNKSSMVRGNAIIRDDNLSNLYEIVDGSFSISKHAEFIALDSPYGNHGLNCIVTLLETHSTPPYRNVGDNNSSSSESSYSYSDSSESSSLNDGLMAAKLTFPFTFFGGSGPNVKINNIEIATVSKAKISLNSTGSSGVSRDFGGKDEGATIINSKYPTTPIDLPLGIREVNDVS